jgi:hypothetical protein
MPLEPWQETLLAEVTEGLDLRRKLREIEKGYLWAGLYMAQGVRPRAAGLLGITQEDLRRRMVAYNMIEDWPDIKLNENTRLVSRTGTLLTALRAEPWAPRLRTKDWGRIRRLIDEET